MSLMLTCPGCQEQLGPQLLLERISKTLVSVICYHCWVEFEVECKDGVVLTSDSDSPS